MTPSSNSTKRKFTRAEFLCLAAGAGAALAAPGMVAGEVHAAGPQLMNTIPKSGEKIPAVGLGTARTFNVGTDPAARAPRREVVRLFFEQGGTVIDSSPMYGRAEQVTGDFLADLGLQKKAFLATKVWTSGREAGIGQMNNSMRFLRTKTINLMQVHNLSDTRTQLRTLSEWKDAGKIRYIGITHYTASALDDLAGWIKREPAIRFVQFPYSIAVREAERRFIPFCAERGVATLVNRPFENGGLFRTVRGKKVPEWAGEFGAATWGRFFLKYILSVPGVTSVIPATSKPRHLLDNMGAGRGPLPDPATRRKMARLWQSL
jgi:aryl-alcohol dehydrogenase-like predicted oxidoreductase